MSEYNGIVLVACKDERSCMQLEDCITNNSQKVHLDYYLFVTSDLTPCIIDNPLEEACPYLLVTTHKSLLIRFFSLAYTNFLILRILVCR